MPRKNSLISRMSAHIAKKMESDKEGGWSEKAVGWCNEAKDSLLKAEDVNELFEQHARDAWRRIEAAAASADQHDLAVNGAPIAQFASFADPSVPRGKRTVHRKYLTIAQFGKALDLKKKQYKELRAVIRRESKQYELLLDRAGGDENKLVKDHADAIEDVA